MKIEIWSDIMCPFCYIGKKHFEKALNELPFKQNIEVVWKSYQLNPDYYNKEEETIFEYLSRSKGMSIEQAKGLTTQVVDMAIKAGIQLDFNNNIPANTFNAHRLLHLAAHHGIQDLAEEKFFQAHFQKRLNLEKREDLLMITSEIGLNKEEVEGVLDSDKYAEAVRYDIYESQQIGVRGVPYFVLDRKYAISGAQPIETFTAALTQSYNEWKEAQPSEDLKNLNSSKDAYCDDAGCAI